MADTLTLYGRCGNKLSDWTATGTIKLMLCTSLYTPNYDTHEYKSSVTNEITSVLNAGYTSGGKTLSSLSTSYVASSNETLFDATDVVWTGELTARQAICYVEKTANETSPLLFNVTFTGDKTIESGTLTFTWDADGIFKTTV